MALTAQYFTNHKMEAQTVGKASWSQMDHSCLVPTPCLFLFLDVLSICWPLPWLQFTIRRRSEEGWKQLFPKQIVLRIPIGKCMVSRILRVGRLQLVQGHLFLGSPYVSCSKRAAASKFVVYFSCNRSMGMLLPRCLHHVCHGLPIDPTVIESKDFRCPPSPSQIHTTG